MITGTELAKLLGVSRQRIHQYVTSGKLEGCYTGEGQFRRFDPAKCAEALGKRLDPGQMMGNGASTRAALRELADGAITASPSPQILEQRPAPFPAPVADPDSYEFARTQKAQEEARRLRRLNAEAEGKYVLAVEAAAHAGRMIGRELTEFENVLRDGSRLVADKLGVDFKTVRQLMVETWRGHRTKRTEALQAQAEEAHMSEAEEIEDI